jgi:hypothetical protein
MPEPPPTPAPTGTGSTFDIHATYCRTCRQALNVFFHKGTGVVEYLHTVELRGGTADHPAAPAPLTEIDQPVMECDFCSRPEAVWAYVCAEQDTQRRVVTSRVVDARDYRDRHHAARARHVQTAEAPTHAWGQRWTSCAGCAELIEARDLYGLISRVTDTLPAKYTRGKNLARTRAQLHATYSTFLATLAPGRGRITPQAPLGQWPEPPPSP